MIEFSNIHKSFGATAVLKGISLKIEEGEVVFIVGSSGAGKSVLMKHLIGLERPDSGRVHYRGVDITDYSERAFYGIRRKCAMVFQHSTLFDSMTLAQNVALPLLKHLKLSSDEAIREAKGLLEKVDLGSLTESFPAEIGAGLQKRAAIARALACGPEAIIFDEPTTALDPAAALDIDQLIRQLSDRVGVTCVVVSHDLRSMFTISDRIVFLYQGVIYEEGPASVFLNSTDPVVQQFVTGSAQGPMLV